MPNPHTTILTMLWSLVSAAILAVTPVSHDDAEKTIALPADADGALKALTDSPRHGEWVDIDIGTDTKLRTWIVYPERSDKAPVVIVIHEIFGLTDWVRGVADQLAAEGFIAVAPDLLSGMGPDGGGTESLGENVRATIAKLSSDETGRRLDAARAYAIKLPSATEKTASIGFCWGGSASFAYAAQQPKLNGAVVYYGTAPQDDDALKKIECDVLGLYGQDDARVTSTVELTKQRMRDAGETYEAHVYDKAGHGFLRQQSGKNGANAHASQQAWKETIDFLKKRLE